MPKRFFRILAVALAMVVAVLALTSVVAGPTPAPVEAGISAGVDEPDDVVEHTARPGTRVAALIPFVVLGALFVMARPASRRLSSIRRRYRRIGDVGDDWRALLLGAPPHAA